MKLRLLATASQHTANFKVMAAEYRFTAEGLEMLDSEIKTPLLNIGKNLTEEELTEVTKAFASHIDKKGLSLITAVMSECEKSDVLMAKAQKLVSEFGNKKESSFGKNADLGWKIIDFFRGKNQIDLKDGTLKNVINYVSSKLVRIGLLIIVAATIYGYMFMGERILLGAGEGLTGYLPSYGLVSLDDLVAWFKSGAATAILGLAVKTLAGAMSVLGFTRSETFDN